jgi:hypothetical protein
MKRSRSRSRSVKLNLVLKKGSLGKYGYKAKSPKTSRQASLKKALKGVGYSTLIKKLNVLSIYNKNVNPKLSASVKGDMKYVRKLRSYE